MADFEELTPEERERREQRAAAIRKKRAKERRIRRGQRRWRVFMAVYSIVFLLAGAVGCVVLYRYAAAYEVSIPEHVMDKFMDTTSEEAWYDYVRAGAQMPDSTFEDSEALFDAYYNAAIRGSEFSYWKYMAEYTAETPVYKVRGGGVDLCLVRLVPKGQNAAGFGRQLWQVGSVESVLKLDNLESVAVEIDAPEGDSVYINGVLVGPEYLTGERVPVPGITPLEMRFDRQPTFVRYRVDHMYGQITVTDADGRALAPDRDAAAGVVRYAARESTVYSFTVRAPSTVKVTVCGALLTEEDAVRSDAGILSGLRSYIGDAGYNTLVYSFDGLFTPPEIVATAANGAVLTPMVNDKGEMIFFQPENKGLASRMKPRVEEFFQRYIDYSAHAYNAGRHQALLDCILPDTDLYRYVRDSRDAMIWASATEVHYDELTFADFFQVSENCFTCTIRYKADFDATTWHESYSYDLQNAYELAFVRSDGVWYAASMSAVSG